MIHIGDNMETSYEGPVEFVHMNELLEAIKRITW